MFKLESIQSLVSITETGSITAAAHRLAISKSVVSERLGELERVLGTKLLHRTTRRLSLTEDGTAFLEKAKRILADVDEAASEIAERRGKLSGNLRISGPVSFGSLHLGPALFGFLAKHPGIQMTLELEDRFVNVLTEGFDAVVRHGPVDDKRIIVKHLAASRRVLVASPQYLKRHGTPTSLQDLERHSGILFSYRGADWRFRMGRKFVTARPAAALRVNNGLLMRDAAVAGLGLALLPAYFLGSPLKKRALKAIDIGAEAEGATLFLAYPEHLRSSGKIRALTAWLQDFFGDPAYWDG